MQNWLKYKLEYYLRWTTSVRCFSAVSHIAGVVCLAVAALMSSEAHAAAPVAGPVTVNGKLNVATAVDLLPFISGAGVTGANLESQPQFGNASVSGTTLTYIPHPNFFGQDVFTYSATGSGLTSATATITVNISGRPDPATDPIASALISAQSDSAKRFSRTQISNIQQRLETLRRATGRDEHSSVSGNQVSKSQVLDENGNAFKGFPVRIAALNAANRQGSTMGSGLSIPSFGRDVLSETTIRSLDLAQMVEVSLSATADRKSAGITNYWVEGYVNFGARDATSNRSALDFTTNGVTAGVDYRLTNKIVLGAGIGYARDRSDAGEDGTRSRSYGYSIAAYGSYQPTANTFVDGILGVGSLQFDTDRYVPAVNDFARANRDGTQIFGALTAGYEYRGNGILLSPYGRVDFTIDKLKQATEVGAGLNALTYFEQTQRSAQGALGLRAESVHEASFGWVVPRLLTEFRYDTQGEQQVSISYADQVGAGSRYALGTGPVDHSTIVVGVGSDFILRNGLTLGVDYQYNYASAQNRSQTIRLRLQMDLDGKPRKPGFLGTGVAMAHGLDLQVDGGYSYDDNINRASSSADKLSDYSFNANVSNNWLFPVNENMRGLVTAILGGEKFRNYDGLSHVSGGLTGELQYRTSGAFDAPTFALFGKAFVERFESDRRDGSRYSVGVSVLKPLTDRVTAFGSLTHEERYARSAVFDGKHNSARLNFDYALHQNGTVYIGGEYRRGDIVSTAHPTLANLDIARVFTQDDVFGRGFASYRLDAKTWIGTIGYNLGFGPRDSLDLSWRRVQSTPVNSVSFAAPGFRYVVNQFNVVYLMRF